MKKIILLAFIALIIAGCTTDEELARQYEKDGFATLTYDSCEYIFRVEGYKGFIAHKGNCHFCKERRQKELKELVEQLNNK